MKNPNSTVYFTLPKLFLRNPILFLHCAMEHHRLSMEEQKKKPGEIFENWKGNLEQIDDVLAIGINH